MKLFACKHKDEDTQVRLFENAGEKAIQGRRREMEDAHIHSSDDVYAWFGVFDGHSGIRAAQYCAKHLVKKIKEDQYFEKEHYKRAFTRGFIHTDASFCSEATKSDYTDGTTAVLAMITRISEGMQRILVIANAGDSRAVICKGGRGVVVTTDHKPRNKMEQKRIIKWGGMVIEGTVNGVLCCSRSIGDVEFKQNTPIENNPVTSEPDVWKYLITDDVEFLILACDGVWDVLDTHTAVSICRKTLREHKYKASKAAEALVTAAFEKQSMDNLTAIVVVLNIFK